MYVYVLILFRYFFICLEKERERERERERGGACYAPTPSEEEETAWVSVCVLARSKQSRICLRNFGLLVRRDFLVDKAEEERNTRLRGSTLLACTSSPSMITVPVAVPKDVGCRPGSTLTSWDMVTW